VGSEGQPVPDLEVDVQATRPSVKAASKATKNSLRIKVIYGVKINIEPNETIALNNLLDCILFFAPGKKNMTIHFISIGGSVMHQLAIALQQKGHLITGSDDEIFEPARTNLQVRGLLPPAIGWFESNIHAGLDAVILGMHARADNPELQMARSLGLPVYSFPEYIHRESLQKKRVVVGGSHGKTTTTGIIMHVLKHRNIAFDYLVGARLDGFEHSVQLTNAPVLVCEGDEYPASAVEKRPKFHFLFPHVAILTGIAWDHINVFPTFDLYLEQFQIFIEKIEPGGVLIYNQQDECLQQLVNESARTDLRFQPYSVPEHRIQHGRTRVLWPEAEADLQVFGQHNLLNIEAARLAAAELGISTEQFAESISDFRGAARRLEMLFQNDECICYRDFAHAPSKVKATLAAVREQYPGRRLIVLLELHTYSSLNAQFLPQYAHALDAADVAAVYFSRHALDLKRMPMLQEETINAGFGRADLEVFGEPASLQQWLKQLALGNSVVLLMSSGSFDETDFIECLHRPAP
jgi:UDP-N-acetylmuramate: L-alanyl-gamma-D-glutamyl-meso-diaminopimelate ligase